MGRARTRGQRLRWPCGGAGRYLKPAEKVVSTAGSAAALNVVLRRLDHNIPHGAPTGQAPRAILGSARISESV